MCSIYTCQTALSVTSLPLPTFHPMPISGKLHINHAIFSVQFAQVIHSEGAIPNALIKQHIYKGISRDGEVPWS